MEKLIQIFSKIDSIVWGAPLLILLVGTGIYLTVRLGFLQIRKLPLAFKYLFSKEDEDTDSLKTNTEPVINNTGDEDNKEPEPPADDGDSSLDTPPT